MYQVAVSLKDYAPLMEEHAITDTGTDTGYTGYQDGIPCSSSKYIKWLASPEVKLLHSGEIGILLKLLAYYPICTILCKITELDFFIRHMF